MLLKALQQALASSSHHHQLKEIMDYAVIPAGKLFRPRLVEALALDLEQKLQANHYHLASSIELHHAYTLVHDDLPAMDNDSIRRGKPSTHAHYGEWKAILAGDALLILSFQELMKINHPEIQALHRLYTWCTGAKGLISGQFLDLSADGKMEFHKVLRIHELKTARLIQVATLGTYQLSAKTQNLRQKLDFLRLGREIGVTFQLLDDLSELTVSDVSGHEKLINPFLLSPDLALKELICSHQRLLSLFKKHQLHQTQKMLQDYFENGQKNLLTGMDNLERNLSADCSPEIRQWITSFV